MKLLHFALCVFAIQVVNCRDGETFTETLLRAQQELSLSHKFTENQFINHRIMITGILEKLTKFSIDKYLDAIDVVKRVAAETREQMMTYESSPCTTNARDRWERQVLSHVNRVNYCIQEATRILIGEYYDLWYFDKDGARVSNHVQNQGVNIMTQNDVMDSNNDFYTLINRRLRDLLLRAGPWVAIMEELIELMNHHTEMAEFGVTICTQMTALQFNSIAADALKDIERCSS